MEHPSSSLDAAERPPRWRTPCVLFIIGPLVGALVGAATNALNFWVCSYYFVEVMGWYDASGWSLFRLTLGQGIIEGAALGTIVAIVFTIATIASTRLRCPLPLALSWLARGIGAVLACWLLGGLCGMLLSWFAPSFWGSVFVGVPEDISLARFAWVGGTIWGAYAGAALATVICSVGIHVAFRKKFAALHQQGFQILTPASAEK